MTLHSGTRIGPYEIVAPLGAGGMGEVYRARDTRLSREVAIKVLPAEVAQSAERLGRFRREAQLLASLNHPNIAAIYGLEELGATPLLVLELVPGEDLSERLKRGAVPLEEAMAIARQIAEALEEAHEKGIVHRDLKPANVKLTPEGKVKVLDFGLAKAYASEGATSGSFDLANSPTLSHAATMAGVILGTAAYMSPEQAAGAVADRRGDIWSFGVVFYELLTGRRLFEGETTSHVLASVLKDAPDFSLLPAEIPERIVNLLRRCLRKKLRERLQAIGDARIVIEEVLADPQRDQPAGAKLVAPVAASHGKLSWILTAIGIVGAGIFATLWLGAGNRTAPGKVLHAALVAPEDMEFGDTFELSPDGTRIAFEAFNRRSGARSLWLRALDSGKTEALSSTDGGELPFWSPDGAQLGFFADGKLKRVDAAGGPAQVICDAPTPRGAAWGPDGRIVFSPSFRVGLSIVTASGGTPQPLTTLDLERSEKSHRFPVFLPDGKVILFLAQTAESGARNDESAIEALELASGKRTRLISANSSPLFSAAGQILFWRDGALLAVDFDAKSLKLAGDPMPVASPVAYTPTEQVLASVSDEGTLVYRAGTRGTFSSLVWLDRNGIANQVIRDRELIDSFALSHDGTRLAYSVNSVGQGSTDLWVHDTIRGVASRLSFDEGGEDYPVWTRDDRVLYYSNDNRNDGTIFRRASDGSGAAEEIGTTPTGIWPLDVASDGTWLVVGSQENDTDDDIFRFDIASKQISALVATPFRDGAPALSPDDRLLAYASEQSGRWEIYVQALGGGGTWQLSTEGGTLPRWSAKARELFYLAGPNRMMVVTVEPGDVPRFSAPLELFQYAMTVFAVTPDGQRIVALRPADLEVQKPLMLITNWAQRRPKQ